MPVTVIMICITVAGILFYHGRKTVHSCRSITSVCRPEKSSLKNVGRWVEPVGTPPISRLAQPTLGDFQTMKIGSVP